MIMANKNGKIQAERKALEAEIRKHKSNIFNIEKILKERKQVEELRRQEQFAKISLEHPKLASAGRALKRVLKGSSDALAKATDRYKKYAKKRPPTKMF